MKVICIDVKPYNNGTCEELVVGETYTVVNSFIYGEKILVYQLEELPPPTPFHGYDSRRFIPVSEIDETEFVRNYNKELV